MGTFASSQPSDRDAVQLGRAHEVPAEIHYASGSDRWWYNGQLWVSETRPVRGYDLDPDLTDPRNGPILSRMEKGDTDEQIATWLMETRDVDMGTTRTGAAGLVPPPYEFRRKRADAIVRRIRWARDHASDPHLVRFYGFRNAAKDEERVLASVDQDLISEAPMVPYTQTEKGWKRVQTILFVGMALAYVVLFGTMISFSSIPQLATQTSQQVVQQFASSILQILELVAIPLTGMVVWWWKSRSTYVLDIQVQPLAGTLLDAHTEPVFLVNSTKTPVSMYMSHVLRVGMEGIDTLATAVRNFETDTIAQMREQIASLRAQLDSAKLTGLDSLSDSLDLAALNGRRQAPIIREGNVWATVLVAAIIAVVAVAVTYAVMVSGA